MKPFVFKLQTALDLKAKEEDKKKEELQKATQLYRDAIDHLNSLKEKMLEVQAQVRRNQQNCVEFQMIKMLQDFILTLISRISDQEAFIETCRIAMEQVRSGLLAVMKDRKVLEKLKERHYQAYLKECQREEQKTIDEMATISYTRKISSL